MTSASMPRLSSLASANLPSRSDTEPASAPKMPAQSYKWNETNVDIILENMDQDETVREKNITGFFKGINVE